MLPWLALLLVFQLAGEAARHALALPVPGPVLGMLALLLALGLRGWLKRDGDAVPESLERAVGVLEGRTPGWIVQVGGPF